MSAVDREALRATLCDRIHKARQELGWAQQDVANELGVTQATVSRWENPSRPDWPHAADLVALAKLTDRTVDWFLGLSYR